MTNNSTNLAAFIAPADQLKYAATPVARKPHKPPSGPKLTKQTSTNLSFVLAEKSVPSGNLLPWA